MRSWVKSYRDEMHSPIWPDAYLLKVWTYCRYKANRNEKDVLIKTGKGTVTIHVQRGQFITGRIKQEEELQMDDSMVRRKLRKLSDLGRIKIEPTHQYSIITVCNYDDYQGKTREDEASIKHQRSTNKAPMKPNKNLEENKISEEAKLILQYLNEVTAKKFKSIIENLFPIQKCLDYGYKFDDMKAVIDHMTEKWKGTKYDQYLRPSTLFKQPNFDNYVNAKPVMNKSKIPVDDGKTGNVY